MKIGEVEKDSHLIVKVFSKMMKDGEEVRSPKSLDFPVKIQKVYPTGLAGVCVRKKTIAKDKFLYGCKLKYEDPNLRKFINEKQRARMKTE